MNKEFPQGEEKLCLGCNTLPEDNPFHKQNRIEYVKLIRKELLKERPVWEFIRSVSRIAGLQDTAYRDKIERHDVQGLLMDYLLDLKYHTKIKR